MGNSMYNFSTRFSEQKHHSVDGVNTIQQLQILKQTFEYISQEICKFCKECAKERVFSSFNNMLHSENCLNTIGIAFGDVEENPFLSKISTRLRCSAYPKTIEKSKYICICKMELSKAFACLETSTDSTWKEFDNELEESSSKKCLHRRSNNGKYG